MKLPTEIARERFAGKRVTVVGLAREGVSLVRFLAAAGAEVTANDHAPAEKLAKTLEPLAGLPVRYVLGGHPEEIFRDVEAVFVSPGVPQELDFLVQARRRGTPLSSETQLFFELCRGKLVGITGSSGKTTTTTLVGEMLRRAGLPVHVGGNIGVPLLERLDQIGTEDLVVLEMSSFQLETLPYSPSVGAILNITPNHLDRHGDMDTYVAAKWNMLSHQRPQDWAILSADDPIASGLKPVGRRLGFSLERQVEGSYLDGDRIVLRRGTVEETVCEVGDVQLRGRHNLLNVAAASAIASVVGVPVESMRAAVRDFKGVPHRLEVVGVVKGVTYCNDSIATAPERSIASIRSFGEPIVL
ncbi:MAG TPA: UDP-N-acetylmuramoyl-L-alanine--D-glutamate ligase, partial [Chloroflexota bacterium]|nr:UDP-N-acetylmuramoyl-L-alanine--D-glutamate ligase [Chloroflexota bacterium]